MHNPIIDNILARRSIRAFTDEIVSRETFDVLLHAAMAAPSACNLQPWEFVVVDDPAVLEQLYGMIQFGASGKPCAIVVCGRTQHIPWGDGGYAIDCAAAVQNLLLAATSLGLGTLWIGSHDEAKVRELLSIPEPIKVMSVIYVGHPAIERIPCTWYTPDAVYYNGYDASRQRTMRTMDDLRKDQ